MQNFNQFILKVMGFYNKIIPIIAIDTQIP